MSYYVWGSSLSWNDYLQAESFVSDITTSVKKSRYTVGMEISRQTREIIASNDALSHEHIRTVKELSDSLEYLSYDLLEISSSISELNATFHWGFGELISGIGHMNDILSELIKVAKTPIQIVAFNHFEIARDAFRQNLLQDALEELQKAINGDHVSSGYKLEWRFHQMVGTIRLGFVGGDMSLIDLPLAEQAFLMVSRYAKADYPAEAGRAFLSAGWAAYCQGKLKEALAHCENAITCHSRLGEAFFLSAKVLMALDEVDKALPMLKKAINLDCFYVIKAASDGDFQKYDERLRVFFEEMRKEKYLEGVSRVTIVKRRVDSWGIHAILPASEKFVREGMEWPLIDILHGFKDLETELETRT